MIARVPLYITMFFIILAIVNVIFITVASNTHTGVVTKGHYQKGLKYNQVISASNAQDSLGWYSKIIFDGQKTMSFFLKDKKGNAINNANVTAYISRPTQEGYDFAASLDMVHKGEYKAEIDFPLKGQWDIRIGVIWQEQYYQQRKRIIVD